MRSKYLHPVSYLSYMFEGEENFLSWIFYNFEILVFNLCVVTFSEVSLFQKLGTVVYGISVKIKYVIFAHYPMFIA